VSYHRGCGDREGKEFRVGGRGKYEYWINLAFYEFRNLVKDHLF
jgi:hypothetical protein